MKTYDSYKKSGIEWIGEIPSHWEKSRLANKGNFYKGRGVSKADLTIDGLPVILYGDLYTKYSIKTSLIERRIPKEVAEHSFLLEKNDLLFAASGETPEEIGKCICFLGEEEAYAGGDLIVFRQEQNNSLFLSYLFNSYRINEEKAKASKGEIVVHIYAGQLRDIHFPLPPLGEQFAIASYLDRKTAEIDELIADKKRLLDLYEEEKSAVINQAATKGINPDAPMKDSGIEWLGEIPRHWEVKKLKHVAELKSGNNIVSEQIKETSQFPVFGGNGIRGYFDNYTHEGTHILIGRQGAYCGNIQFAKGKFWASEHAVVLTPKENYDYRYLGELLRAMDLGQYSVSAAQPGISVEVIKNLTIPFPSFTEQKIIADRIEALFNGIESKLSKTRKLIDLLTEYRTALISEVVTGKVKVTD